MTFQRCRNTEYLPSFLLLAGLFFLSLLWGRHAALRVPQVKLAEVEAYLAEYVSLGRFPLPETIISAFILYFRYPLIAFLLGFSSAGIILLPLTGAVFGFFLSFSVCCFTAVFGAKGVLLALAVFGFRCLLTIPCFFLLAIPSMESAGALAAVWKRGRRAAPVIYGKEYWIRMVAVAVVLIFGVFLELIISPRLLEAILERILI